MCLCVGLLVYSNESLKNLFPKGFPESSKVESKILNVDSGFRYFGAIAMCLVYESVLCVCVCVCVCVLCVDEKFGLRNKNNLV